MTPAEDTLTTQPSSSLEEESVKAAKQAKYTDVVSTVWFSHLHK